MPIPGLPRKPTYELEVLMCTGERWLHGKDVRAEHVREVLIDWLVVHRGPGLVIRIDGEDRTAAVWAAIGRDIARRSGKPLPPEPDDVGGPGHLDVASAWRFLLTDDNVLHRLPLAADVRGDEALCGGKGPGDLWWHPTCDHGMPGVRAVHRGGMFKILRVCAEQHALVYERKAGDWEAIATGSPEALKERAAASVRGPERIPDYGGLKRPFRLILPGRKR